MQVIVYNIETGKPVKIEGVDAVEYVKSGGWSRTPPEKEEEKKPKTIKKSYK